MQEIAVIIPLYNGARWIERTLLAVRNQTRPAAEIVVVDDASTDAGPAIARSVPGIRFIANRQKGSGHARNLGLAESRSPLVAFLDQDDLWHPRHLELLGRALDADPHAVLAASLGESVAEEAEPWFDPDPDASSVPLDLWDAFPFGLIRSPGLALARRSALEAVGVWNTRAVYVADIELWFRLSLLGSVRLVDAVTMGIRVHPDSYSSVLRAERVDQYLGAVEKLAHRLAREIEEAPLDANILQRRVALLSTIADGARAFAARDRAGFAFHAKALLKALDAEPATFRRQTLHTLLWFYSPRALPEEKRPFLVDLLLLSQGHPEAREILWEALRDWPARLWLDECRSHPLDLDRWNVLARSTFDRWRGRGGPARCSGVDPDGWARQVWRVDAEQTTAEIRLQIEVPGWAGIRRQTLEIHSPGAEPTVKELRPGIHTLRLQGSEVVLRAAELFTLPGQTRRRSLRVRKAQEIPSASPSPHAA